MLSWNGSEHLAMQMLLQVWVLGWFTPVMCSARMRTTSSCRRSLLYCTVSIRSLMLSNPYKMSTHTVCILRHLYKLGLWGPILLGKKKKWQKKSFCLSFWGYLFCFTKGKWHKFITEIFCTNGGNILHKMETSTEECCLFHSSIGGDKYHSSEQTRNKRIEEGTVSWQEQEM